MHPACDANEDYACGRGYDEYAYNDDYRASYRASIHQDARIRHLQSLLRIQKEYIDFLLADNLPFITHSVRGESYSECFDKINHEIKLLEEIEARELEAEKLQREQDVEMAKMEIERANEKYQKALQNLQALKASV